MLQALLDFVSESIEPIAYTIILAVGAWHFLGVRDVFPPELHRTVRRFIWFHQLSLILLIFIGGLAFVRGIYAYPDEYAIIFVLARIAFVTTCVVTALKLQGRLVRQFIRPSSDVYAHAVD